MRWRGITKPGVFELGVGRSTQEQSFREARLVPLRAP